MPPGGPSFSGELTQRVGTPLEEVIVGRLEGAVIPSDHPVVTCNIPDMAARAQSLFAGFHFQR